MQLGWQANVTTCAHEGPTLGVEGGRGSTCPSWGYEGLYKMCGRAGPRQGKLRAAVVWHSGGQAGGSSAMALCGGGSGCGSGPGIL